MEDEGLNWFQKHEAMLMSIFRWVFLGVIASMLPFLFMLFRMWLSDLVATELEYLPDLLLIIFAISVSAINLLWDDAKKISKIAKGCGIVILIGVIVWCMSTYATLFEQTIYSNKLLEAYNQLPIPTESNSANLVYSTAYEDSMRQLHNVKEFIDVTGLNPKKVKHFKDISILALVFISICGIVAEYRNDKNRQKLYAIPKRNGISNPIPSRNESSKNTAERGRANHEKI